MGTDFHAFGYCFLAVHLSLQWKWFSQGLDGSLGLQVNLVDQPGFVKFLFIPIFYLTQTNPATKSTRYNRPAKQVQFHNYGLKWTKLPRCGQEE